MQEVVAAIKEESNISVKSRPLKAAGVKVVALFLVGLALALAKNISSHVRVKLSGDRVSHVISGGCVVAAGANLAIQPRGLFSGR